MLKLAFMGLRHAHIYSLLKHARETPGVEIVGVCEEDRETRAAVTKAGTVTVTHDSYAQMLLETDCDAVAIGDYYGRRGAIAIEALKRGKHVISDKPLCTSLAELEEIQSLAAANNLKIGIMLDLRDGGTVRKAHELIRGGAIGAVHAVVFTAEHPLMPDSRPGWYFEKGKHGGTLNDIGIHAIDLIPWITGLNFTRLEAARSWNSFAEKTPWMHDAGQFMATLENGAGVMGEVSYFMPDSMGYSLPQYWRMTFFGRNGMLELVSTQKSIMLAKNGDKAPLRPEPALDREGGYLQAFLAEVNGTPIPAALCTADILRASRQALLIQEAGEKGLAHVALS
jgi:predicted dehydrogenase